MKRIESGSIRFGEDWAGVYFRGDDAFAFANAVDHALTVVREPVQMSVLREFRDSLRNCREPANALQLRPAAECLPETEGADA